jgi:ACS family tartrate transporter-like MFS transporter
MDIEARTMRRVTLRLVPFLILCYFVAFLDRVNLSFAALTMNKDLNISSTVFGQAAGIFFLSYFLLEVPSNLALAKFGARRWIARIMFTWGIISGCMAFVVGDWSFAAVRFLLGAAEAGFFPGIIFYMTLWFPSAYRARIAGFFMAAIPLSSVLGAPLSNWLLGFDGIAGLAGWKWLFLLEAAPALILSFAVLAVLTDRPAVATWLPPDERDWLIGRIEAEAQQRVSARHYSLMQGLTNPKVLALSLVYFGVVACLYGTSFFLPQIIKQFGLSNANSILLSAVPYIVGVVASITWGMLSDRTGNRRGLLLISLALAAVGTAGVAWAPGATGKLICLSVAAWGIYGSLPVFWTLPTAFLSGASAAGGIAIINALGNLSGYYGPSIMGYLKDRTGGFEAGLQALGAAGAVAFLVVLALHHDRRLERAPDGQPAE